MSLLATFSHLALMAIGENAANNAAILHGASFDSNMGKGYHYRFVIYSDSNKYSPIKGVT
jgi:hypothetical protein